jgi:hypothetical protein
VLLVARLRPTFVSFETIERILPKALEPIRRRFYLACSFHMEMRSCGGPQGAWREQTRTLRIAVSSPSILPNFIAPCFERADVCTKAKARLEMIVAFVSHEAVFGGLSGESSH